MAGAAEARPMVAARTTMGDSANASEIKTPDAAFAPRMLHAYTCVGCNDGRCWYTCAVELSGRMNGLMSGLRLRLMDTLFGLL